MATHTRTLLAMLAPVLLVGGTSLTVASCGQEQSALCKEAADLRGSVNQLQNTSLRENGMGSLTTALTQVRTELSQLTAEAKTQFSPQVAAIRSSVDRVQAQATTAKADPSAAAFGQVGVALGDLGSAVDDLVTAMKNSC